MQKVLVSLKLLDDIQSVFEEYFSDSDYDRDQFLANTEAELHLILFNEKDKK